jgi:hypothetical protein
MAQIRSLIEPVRIDPERSDLIRSDSPPPRSDRKGTVESAAAAWQPVDKPRPIFCFKILETCFNFKNSYLEFYKFKIIKNYVPGFRKMRGTYFWHNISLLPLVKIFYYRLLYSSIMAIKNSYKFYFAVILFAFDQ